ncbi:unnamed protein product, partial [Coccothraustes coccothraustes]
ALHSSSSLCYPQHCHCPSPALPHTPPLPGWEGGRESLGAAGLPDPAPSPDRQQREISEPGAWVSNPV